MRAVRGESGDAGPAGELPGGSPSGAPRPDPESSSWWRSAAGLRGWRRDRSDGRDRSERPDRAERRRERRPRILDLDLTTERAERAEAEVDHLRNLIHDARSAVAGIECATSTLRAYGTSLSPDSRAELEQAVAAELVRLRNLLAPQGASDAGPVARLVPVDDAVQPLVVAHRERGQRVDWSPSRLDALVDGYAIATVVANLLDNALVHAPGTAVRVGVSLAGDAISAVESRSRGRSDGPASAAGPDTGPEAGRGAGRGSGQGSAQESGRSAELVAGSTAGTGRSGASGRSEVEVVVRDQGTGVRPRFVDELFAPGAQGTLPVPGEGRGLAYARQVARRHGGELRLVATGGEGAEFRLRLPAVVGAVIPERVDAAAASDPLASDS